VTDFRQPLSSGAVKRRAWELISRRPKPLTPDQQAARRMSLGQFVRECWQIIEPSTRLAWGWALDAVCQHVEALLTGKLGKQNLIVTVPPGSMKSTIVSVAAPAFMWINRPQWRAIHASGNPVVSVRDSLRCRSILDSPWYRQRFGISWQFATDQNLKTIYANSASGFRNAVSSGSRITGSRADALFVDDALDAADAYSDNARSSIIEWWRSAFANRLNDMQMGTRCVIQQRLHPEDLVGYILATEPDEWEVLTIPQEWEEERRFTTSIGWTDPRTEEGALMFPQRFPVSVVAAERARLGESGYAGQHQQRPFNASGEVFKTGALKFWPKDQPLPAFSQIIESIDSAFKTGEENDYSVAVVLAQFDQGVFILDVIRGRFAYPMLKGVMVEVAAKWRPNAVLVEDKASGQSLIQDLQQNTPLPVRPVKVDGDKLQRAHVIVPTWEAGRIFALEGAPFLPDLLAELHSFPKSVHDDQVDALVQGVRYLTNWGQNTGLLQYYRQEAEKLKKPTAPTPATT
jgi:predicted phage terminase large subunit-like protein